MKKLVAFILIFSSSAFADIGTDRAFAIFVGGGLLTGTQNLTVGGDKPSKFSTQGYVLSGGISMPFSGRSGVELSVDYGKNSAINEVTGSENVEVGTLSNYAGKAGFFYGPFTLGTGYRRNLLQVKSIGLPTPGYLYSEYKGFTPLYFANLTMDVSGRYRGVAEIQYVDGDLEGSAPNSKIKLNELTFSIRAFINFD